MRRSASIATITNLRRCTGSPNWAVFEVALDEAELPQKLDDLDGLTVQPAISPYAPDAFVAAVRAFIIGQPLAPAPDELGTVRELPTVREPRRRAA